MLINYTSHPFNINEIYAYIGPLLVFNTIKFACYFLSIFLLINLFDTKIQSFWREELILT